MTRCIITYVRREVVFLKPDDFVIQPVFVCILFLFGYNRVEQHLDQSTRFVKSFNVLGTYAKVQSFTDLLLFLFLLP